VEALQTLGARQSASDAQLVLQAPVAHAYGLHEVESTTRQVPAPLQVRAGVSSALAQAAGAQSIPAE
jgi:hypothetical protein